MLPPAVSCALLAEIQPHPRLAQRGILSPQMTASPSGSALMPMKRQDEGESF